MAKILKASSAPGETFKPLVAANDNEPFRVVCPADWQDLPIPERKWLIPGLVPSRTVTLLSGDGGVGKSLLALQIGIAAVLGVPTLGVKPSQGRVLYLGAEDEEEEFQRRMMDIVRCHHASFSDLNDFLLVPAAGQDATLVLPDKTGTMVATPFMVSLRDRISSFRPTLVVLDTSADLFGGNEIDRGQVRRFVSMLREIAMEFDCAVVLLSHPSVAGMQSGAGTSGSTAWSNSVRSRLYLTADKGEDADPHVRVLTTMKSNYGPVGDALRMRWHEGAFEPDEGVSQGAVSLLGHRAEDVFKDLLSKFCRTGQNASHVSGTSYAPSLMAKHPDAKGVSKGQLVAAMGRLIDDGTVKIIVEGPPSRQRRRLILASEDYRSR